MSGDQWPERSGKQPEQGPGEWVDSDDAPTPPRGLALPQLDPAEETPPQGIGLADLVRSEDVGSGGPAVLGGDDPVQSETGGDAGEWPTLEYRSRREREERPRGRFGWSRRDS